MRTAPAAAVLAAATFLAACGSEPDAETAPQEAEQTLTQVETEGLWMPLTFSDATLTDPGWSAAPQHIDGLYLAPSAGDDVLEFRAVDADGEALWTAERPVSCTGFTVSTGPDGEPVAVLTDPRSSDESLAEVTATAYDLRTGAEVWGPVDVPGPYQGPGLVLAAPPEGPIGETGPRTALDPSTGDPVATEGEDGVDRVIGEYRGTVLTVVEDALSGLDAATGAVDWEIDLAENGWDPAGLVAAFDSSPGGDLALLETADGSGPLIDVSDGTIVATAVREAVLDPTTGAVVVLDHAGMRAVGPDGTDLWEQSVGPDVSLAAAGGVLLFVRDGGAIRVHNVMTGQVAQGYDPDGEGPIVVPEHVSLSGDGVVVHDGRYLVATIPDVAPGSPG